MLDTRRLLTILGIGILLLVLSPSITGFLKSSPTGTSHGNPFGFGSAGGQTPGAQALAPNSPSHGGHGGASQPGQGGPAQPGSPTAHPTTTASPSAPPTAGPTPPVAVPTPRVTPPVLPPPPPANRGTGTRGLYQFIGNSHPEDAANPSIDGSLMLFTWTQVEPQKGVFNWGAIDGPLATWAHYNKKVGLRVYTASMIKYNSSWNAQTAGSATPSWVYADGAKKLVETDGSVLPVYWDPVYERDLQGFVQALGARYNGNPTVVFIQAPTGFDGESFVDGTGNSNALALWQSVGYSDTVWENTVFWTWRLYQTYVTKPVVAVLKGGQITGVNLFVPFAQHAIATGAWVNHNGLAPTPYGSSYGTELSIAGRTTGCMLEELARLSIDATGASQMLQEMQNALAVNAEMVLLYPAEVQAGTAGSSAYQAVWATSLQTAHTEIWR